MITKGNMVEFHMLLPGTKEKIFRNCLVAEKDDSYVILHPSRRTEKHPVEGEVSFPALPFALKVSLTMKDAQAPWNQDDQLEVPVFVSVEEQLQVEDDWKLICERGIYRRFGYIIDVVISV
jgi:hypothetical protein